MRILGFEVHVKWVGFKKENVETIPLWKKFLTDGDKAGAVTAYYKMSGAKVTLKKAKEFIKLQASLNNPKKISKKEKKIK